MEGSAAREESLSVPGGAGLQRGTHSLRFAGVASGFERVAC